MNVNVCEQVIDLNHGELKWLSNHLGRELQIHKTFYRLHESTIIQGQPSADGGGCWSSCEVPRSEAG